MEHIQKLSDYNNKLEEKIAELESDESMKVTAGEREL